MGKKKDGPGRPKLARREPTAMMEATALIDKAQPKAAKVLYDLLDSEEAGIRLKAAVALLNKRIPDVTKTQVEGGAEDKHLRIISRDEAKTLTDAELISRLAEITKN